MKAKPLRFKTRIVTAAHATTGPRALDGRTHLGAVPLEPCSGGKVTEVTTFSNRATRLAES